MIDRSDRLWFKKAVIYQVHLKAYCDANNDGIGDFAGLMQKLDYVQDLGVNTIWLLPFYPSPLRDDGYDIADYRSVNPAYGTMRDFRQMVRECHARGLRVVTELVINHTSDQHPWFQRARRAKKGSIYRDYYVWSDSDEKYPDARIIFVDSVKSNWSWDPVAEAYYWHRFYPHQPDLNFDNPRVLREVINVMRFWLDMGVDGLRLDAIPYLVERDGTNCENLQETHSVIKAIRAEIDANYPDRILLAEANQWPEDAAVYFGAGDECHMCFHFPLMPRMYMAIAQEDRHPITDIMRQTPEIPDNCQWAVFLRNHDELTLEMVTNRERDYLWSFFAADKKMRINLGIRRRLAPLLENDRRKIELMNSLLFSLPGTPILYYGDEIGMGDNVYLGDRDGVRTPMQWSPDRNGGFSRADPSRLYLPPIMDPIYGFEAVNIEAQTRSPSSLLNWMKRLISMRRQNKALQSGTLRFLYPGNRKVLAYLREFEGEAILCVANLSHSAQAVELDLSQFKSRVPIEILGRSAFPPIGDLPYLVTLSAYGFHWFALPQEAEMPSWHHEMPPPLPEFITLVTRNGWGTVLTGREAAALETNALPAYIAKQRWFVGKDDKIARARIAAASILGKDKGGIALLQVAVELAASGQEQRYLLPLAASWDDEAGTVNWPLLPATVARIRRHNQVGAVYETTAADAFAAAMVDAIRSNTQVEDGVGVMSFCNYADGAALDPPPEIQAKRIGGEQSNTSLAISDRFLLKIYRRLADGTHPEVEMLRYLTGPAGYANTPKLLGAVEYADRDGTKRAVAILQELVRTQGDGWAHAMNYLDRVFHGLREVGSADEALAPAERHAAYLEQIRVLGRRVAEMHCCLGRETEDPAFRPEPISDSDMAGWGDGATRLAKTAFAALRKAAGNGEPVGSQARALLERRNECLERIRSLAGDSVSAMKSRIHGDLHLGQVLVVKNDFDIIDFEGEPARTLEGRRAKTSPMRDIAGMLRSFHYAAWSALFALRDQDPDGFEKLLPYAMEWRTAVQEAFISSYVEAVGSCPTWPADMRDGRRLLDLFILEKVLYEIHYEATNRPNWLRIPVTGLGEVLDALSGRRENTLAAA